MTREADSPAQRVDKDFEILLMGLFNEHFEPRLAAKHLIRARLREK